MIKATERGGGNCINIGIAGAGLMGRLIGWKLSQLGHTVTLFDKDLSGKNSAAYAAAGMLSPFAESVISQELVFTLGMESLALWPQLIKNISPHIFFNQSGSIVTCHNNDASELRHFMQRISSQVNTKLIEPLTHEAIKLLEPDLRFKQGYHLQHEAHLDTQQFIKELNTYFKLSKYVSLIEDTVKCVTPQTILTESQRHNFDFIFDCRGRGGEQHFEDLRSVRGEIIHVYAPDVNLQHTIRLTHPRYPLYIVPMSDHRYIIGATEIESEDTSPISVRSCLELLNAAYSIHPGFAEARILETRTAQRPTLIDNLPRIIYEDGLIAVNGLYRHGFLIAPALMQACIKLFCTGTNNQLHPGLIKEKTHA